MAVDQVLQGLDDLRPPATGLQVLLQRRVIRGANPEALAIVGQHLKPLDVLHSFAGHDRVGAT